jgi:hypothetical protein
VHAIEQERRGMRMAFAWLAVISSFFSDNVSPFFSIRLWKRH